ncbi:MAG: competence protein CoiA family protein, partial [Ruminococcus sp.]|nr:competence protein CoiA family protein [Ruminococcus sp.]
MILFALDLEGNRVYIENAFPRTAYLCEECGTRLIAKNQGLLRQHHFAHKPDENSKEIQRLCDIRSSLRTENQMSEWHKSWQNRFPEKWREVVFKDNGKIFRADICRENTKEIIEFQHSRITAEDFNARNEFYNSLGYTVIWLFDFDEIKGMYKYIHPNNYDDFIKRTIR